MKPIRVMVARFPYGGWEHADICDWMVGTILEMKSEARVATEICRTTIDDTPVTMSRNRCVKQAQENEIDFLLMVDSDMKPDAYLPSNTHCIAPLADAKPFWPTSFEFLWNQRLRGQPSVIAAPYCGPPPLENVYVFHWCTKASDVPDDETNFTLEQFHRTAAHHMKGITEVGALPTGLILIDMQALEKIEPPYFYYEHDVLHTEKHSTEDVTFTRDLGMRGVKQYCNWDAWAGHWKRKCVGKPHIVTGDQVGEKFETAVLRKYNINPGETLVQVEPSQLTSQSKARLKGSARQNGNAEDEDGKGHPESLEQAEPQGEVQQHRLAELLDR